MKVNYTILLGGVISLFSLYFIANAKENNDNNAVLMYFIIYSIPIIFSVLINSLLLKYSENKSSKLKRTIMILFPLFSLLLFLSNDISFQFIGKIGLITFIITNVIWYLSQTKKTN